MAHPKMRADGLGESCLHIACAVATVIVVFLVAGLVGDMAVAASRYWSG